MLRPLVEVLEEAVPGITKTQARRHLKLARSGLREIEAGLRKRAPDYAGLAQQAQGIQAEMVELTMAWEEDPYGDASGASW